MVVDFGNGMAGRTTPAVLGDQVLPGLPLRYSTIFWSTARSKPPANPIEPANLVDCRPLSQYQADIGLAFDGDADRCFVMDERGDLYAVGCYRHGRGSRDRSGKQSGENTP